MHIQTHLANAQHSNRMICLKMELKRMKNIRYGPLLIMSIVFTFILLKSIMQCIADNVLQYDPNQFHKSNDFTNFV